jgi:hypothetical protein
MLLANAFFNVIASILPLGLVTTVPGGTVGVGVGVGEGPGDPGDPEGVVTAEVTYIVAVTL